MPLDRRHPSAPAWWQWPTVLSLDAPVVAVLWQWEFAHVARASLRPAHGFVLAASVWIAYVADRWIEGWRLAPEKIATERHFFYQRWRWPVAACVGAALAADLAVAFMSLGRCEIEAGLPLLAAVLAYLLSHQLIHARNRWRLPKEMCTAVLLGWGAALFPAAVPGGGPASLVSSVALFAALCFANCALISIWERAVDRSHGQTSLAGQFPQGAEWSRRLPWALAVVAAILGCAAGGDARTAAFCAAAAALLLAAVDRLQERCGRRLARVLADVALMTPMAPFIAMHCGQ
jgi:hypothetical protein